MQSGTYGSGNHMLLLDMDEKEKYLQLGKYTKDYPLWLVEKAKEIDNSVVDVEYVKRIIRIIAAEFDHERYEIYKTNNIRESRLITASKVLEKRQDACGGIATLVASVFRSLGIPTKIVHGRFIENDPEMRHAWNEVLLENGKWIPFDLNGKRREISEYYIREFEVVDWEEVEDIIDTI